MLDKYDKDKIFKETYEKFDGKFGDLVQKYVDLWIAYDILMNYWDSLPEEERTKINEDLKKLGL